MLLWSLVPIAAGCAALALGCQLLFRTRLSSFRLSAGLVLLAAALASGCEALTLLSPAATETWSRLALSLELMHMVALLLFGAVLIGQGTVRDQRTFLRASAGAAAALVLVPLAWQRSAFEQVVPDFPALTAGQLGKVVYVGLLLGLVVGLAQLESVIRLSPELQRYRLKFVVLGLAAPAAYRIYVATQVLIFSVRWPFQAVVGALVTLMSVGIVAFGLRRQPDDGRYERVEVSPQVVYGSLTVLAVGAYLVVVGLLGQLLRSSGQALALGLSELAVFLLGLLLVVVVASRTARARFRQFVARHFLRSRYDFRAQWLEVTDSFRDVESEDAVFDRLLQLLARTFGADRVSIWSRFDADGRFHQVRSLNLEPAPAPLEPDHLLVARLVRDEDPLAVQAVLAAPHAAGLESFVEETQAALAVPIAERGDCSGFVLLSRPPAGRDYDSDDLDLLRAIAHHVGVLLAQIRLADEQRAGAELAALHRFSAFCLHDIKNLAARLSLVSQNARRHGDDPAFREAALDTVARTARELTGLMGKLRTARLDEEERRELVDLGSLARDVLGSMDQTSVGVLSAPEHVPPVRGAASELQQLVLNLIVNAREAAWAGSREASGGVRIAITLDAGEVVLRVTDNGPGIPPERLRTLLRPFRTTKPDGLGIGLYECRRIAEAHGGRLRVGSQPGQGTTVEVRFPAAQPESTVAAAGGAEE